MGPLQEWASHFFIHLQTEYSPVSPPSPPNKKTLYSTRMGASLGTGKHPFLFISRRKTAQSRPQKHYIVHERGLSKNGQATFFIHLQTEYSPVSRPRKKRYIVHEWGLSGNGRASFLFISRRNTAQPRPKTHYIVYERGLSGNGQATFLFVSKRNTAQSRPPTPPKKKNSTRMGPLRERASHFFIHLQAEYSPISPPSPGKKNII